MHRAKGDRLVRVSVLPVCDNASFLDKQKYFPDIPDIKRSNNVYH